MNRMSSSSLLLLLALLAASSTAEDTTPFSTRMIESVMARQHGVVSSGAKTSTLEAGMLTLAIQSWLGLYHDRTDGTQVATFASYADAILAATSHLFPNASVAAAMPLDRLTIAQALQAPYKQQQPSVEETATLATLERSLCVQRRNQFNGFWYYVYPNWSYIDGAVSLLPYMAATPSWSDNDLLVQLQLLYMCTYNRATALLTHGYDASKTAVWADRVTGASALVWCRSLGWYVTGLVNAWEQLDGCRARTNATTCARVATELQRQANQLCTQIVTYADAATGAWYQLPTCGPTPGNFLESSCTMLFTFAILKGLRLGLLTDNAAGLQATALRAYNYTVTSGTFVVPERNGTLTWNGTVAVCSLNSSATYEYYVNRPVILNHALGEAAFILASVEVERLT
ncbi:hypothetical protein PsorP6_016268 [Peronosclerospora sorghi]|uniref:Uncharacterized protein n=1 Tax=Peronosclerospora sorghi TaxID=230839 RepID=A0ACC0VJG8_9STRA|nr:hypothetical protein PsorP6_016268 [Peronosclerospora sorghi]